MWIGSLLPWTVILFSSTVIPSPYLTEVALIIGSQCMIPVFKKALITASRDSVSGKLFQFLPSIYLESFKTTLGGKYGMHEDEAKISIIISICSSVQSLDLSENIEIILLISKFLVILLRTLKAHRLISASSSPSKIVSILLNGDSTSSKHPAPSDNLGFCLALFNSFWCWVLVLYPLVFRLKSAISSV